MELTKERRGEFVEIRAVGRLDERWSMHVSASLDETIREGVHRIWFNMSDVSYLSSAGIGVLVDFYKKLAEIDGSFTVTEPSPAVLKVLDLSHLSPLLLKSAAPSTQSAVTQPKRRLERENVAFEITEIDRRAAFRCSVIGDPSMLQRGGYRAENARHEVFSNKRLGLGLGAFGSDFDDCRGRYGEFLAVAGAAAYFPTDGSSVPDYIVSAGKLIPEVNVLNALICEGAFASLARFDVIQGNRVATMSEVALAALDIAGTDAVAIAMIAETTGLVGAALRRSPAAGEVEAGRFDYPEIRKWISFTGEPAYVGSLCVIVGVATRYQQSRLSPMLRPMSASSGVNGHFHAAACRYRPIKRTDIDLDSTVRSLMEAQSLQGVLHLLSDVHRDESPGESEFVRGTLWIGPIRMNAEAA